MSRSVALPPFTYLPKKTENGFKDYIGEYSATEFKNTGILCPCSGKTYHNKYTFQHQHLNTEKHKQWLIRYKDKTQTTVCLKCDRSEEQIKSLKVMVGSVDQQNFVLKQTVDAQQKEIEKLKREIYELNENALQFDQHIAIQKEQFSKVTNKCNEIERASIVFMRTLGYDIEE